MYLRITKNIQNTTIKVNIQEIRQKIKSVHSL